MQYGNSAFHCVHAIFKRVIFKKSGNMETVKNISMRDYLFDTLQEKCIILLLFSLLSNIERYFVCRLYKDINWVSPPINKCPSSTTLHQY